MYVCIQLTTVLSSFSSIYSIILFYIGNNILTVIHLMQISKCVLIDELRTHNNRYMYMYMYVYATSTQINTCNITIHVTLHTYH